MRREGGTEKLDVFLPFLPADSLHTVIYCPAIQQFNYSSTAPHPTAFKATIRLNQHLSKTV